MPEPATPPRRKLLPEDKDRIITLAREGHDITSIARQLNLNGQSVNGFVSTARKRGIIQYNHGPAGAAPPTPEFSPELPPEPSAPAVPLAATPIPSHAIQAAPAAQPPRPSMHAVPQPRPAAPQARDDGFMGGRPVVADSSGFTSPSGEIRWTVERIAPPDGVLGTHHGAFTLEDLGQTYGEGTYKITRHEPGRQVAMEYVRKIGPGYGQPRHPRQHTTSASAPGTAAPRPFLARPWNAQESYDPRDPAAAQPRAPFYYGSVPSLQDFARHRAPAEDGSVASEALRQAGKLTERLIERDDRARQNGPEATLLSLVQAQQEQWNSRWEQERRLEKERQIEEERKWERRRDEERERWEREQKAAKDAHERELERIRRENDARLAELKIQSDDRERREAERQKFLMDIEDKRLAVIKEEAEIHRRRLETELQETRTRMEKLQDVTAQEMQDSREATTKAIEANKEELDRRFQEREAQLEREYKLRERGLDKEHELNREILQIQKEHVDKAAGDQLLGMIQTVVKEASKGFERYVDLAKLQSMTPEAQAAAVARGAVDGNVMGAQPAEPPLAPPPAGRAEPGPEVRGAAAAQRPSGNGHGNPQGQAVPAAQPIGSDRMEIILRKGLETPAGREMFENVVSEWALHVKIGNDPSVFASLYLEMLRDETNGEVRKFSNLLFTIMSARPWAQMFAFLRPWLAPEAVEIFQMPQAEKFYEAFRAMVYYTINDFWRQTMAAATNQQEAAVQRQAAPAPAPMPEPVAPPQAPPPQAAPAFRTIAPMPAQAPVEPNGGGAFPSVHQSTPLGRSA